MFSNNTSWLSNEYLIIIIIIIINLLWNQSHQWSTIIGWVEAVIIKSQCSYFCDEKFLVRKACFFIYHTHRRTHTHSLIYGFFYSIFYYYYFALSATSFCFEQFVFTMENFLSHHHYMAKNFNICFYIYVYIVVCMQCDAFNTNSDDSCTLLLSC